MDHVRSTDNPADALSRGLLPASLVANTAWFAGPEWLNREQFTWPDADLPIIEIPELRQHVSFMSLNNGSDLLERYSSYSKLIRIVAYCLRPRTRSEITLQLNANELRNAELRILKLLQANQLADILMSLKNGDGKKSGRIANLSPFLDDNGLIRV